RLAEALFRRVGGGRVAGRGDQLRRGRAGDGRRHLARAVGGGRAVGAEDDPAPHREAAYRVPRETGPSTQSSGGLSSRIPLNTGARIFFVPFVISVYSISQTSSGSTNTAPLTRASSGSSIGGVGRISGRSFSCTVSSIRSVKPLPAWPIHVRLPSANAPTR